MAISFTWISSLFLVIRLIFLGRAIYVYRCRTKALHLEAEFPEKSFSRPATLLKEELAHTHTHTFLPSSITDPDHNAIDRGEWLRRLTDQVYIQRHTGRYNVLTIHTSIDYRFAPKGIVERFAVEYNGEKEDRVIPFEVVVFRKGNLTRFGDGGYLNWCFEGNFERMDNFVVFKNITEPI